MNSAPSTLRIARIPVSAHVEKSGRFQEACLANAASVTVEQLLTVDDPHSTTEAKGAAVMGNHRRGPWSQQEDGMLLNLVQGQGAHNWVRISQVIQSRSPKQCRERYHQNLKPNLKHDPISKDEGEIIERMVREMGKKWAEIARALPGRSDNAVKNWWNGGQNRRKRQGSRQNNELQPSHSPHLLSLRDRRELVAPAHHPGPVLPPLQNQRPLPYTSRLGEPSCRNPADDHHFNYCAQPSSYHSRSNDQQQNSHEPPSFTRSLQLVFRPSESTPQLSSLRLARGFESPLPSPSHSAASNDAPSLVSDNSSYTSGRSPHFGSPIELPLPYRWERRRSSCRASGVYDAEGNYTEHDTPTHSSHAEESKTPTTLAPESIQAPQFKTPFWSQPARRSSPIQDSMKLPNLGSHPPTAANVLPTPVATPDCARPQPYHRVNSFSVQPTLLSAREELRSDENNIDPQLRCSPKDTRMDVANFLSPQ